MAEEIAAPDLPAEPDVPRGMDRFGATTAPVFAPSFAPGSGAAHAMTQILAGRRP